MMHHRIYYRVIVLTEDGRESVYGGAFDKRRRAADAARLALLQGKGFRAWVENTVTNERSEVRL